MEITMARGDLQAQQFTVTEDGHAPEPFDNIWFTVKRNATDRNPLIQKKLSDDTIYETEKAGTFEFVIEPEDTNSMAFGAYKFDIELFRDGSLKRTFTGVLTLTEEVTHYYNEGV